MLKNRLAVAITGLLIVLAPALARAQCVEETRTVRFDKSNAFSLKSFNCSTGPNKNDPRIKVEFHAFSTVAAAMIVGRTPASGYLRRTIGTPKVVQNDIFKIYAGLVDRFGESHATGGSDIGLSIRTRLVPPGEGAPTTDDDQSAPYDKAPGARLRTLLDDPKGTRSYPNPHEINLLKAKTIPPGMKFYFSSGCEKPDDSLPACKRSVENFAMNFWRGMRPADLQDYRKNLTAYNQLVGQKTELPRTGYVDFAERYLSLLDHVSGGNWPEDLLILEGQYHSELDCGGDEPGAQGWVFEFRPRAVELDAVLITNTSRQPVTLDGLFGKKQSATGLRVASPQIAVTSERDPLGFARQTLGPGQSLLVPTRIFLPNSPEAGFEASEEAKQIFAKVGLNGFQGNESDFRPTEMKHYSLGTELEIGAIGVNGRRLELVRQAVNFMEMTAVMEAGSCPYLLAWHATEAVWVNYGKVLHKAPSREREYSETRIFSGFVSRFRIEEREPELALIDQVELVVTLANRETFTLTPNNEMLATRDGRYLELSWGEGIGIDFVLPEGIAESDVTESRFVVTGHYLRYGNLLAQIERQRSLGIPRRAGGSAPSVNVRTAVATGLVCPARAAPGARLLGLP